MLGTNFVISLGIYNEKVIDYDTLMKIQFILGKDRIKSYVTEGGLDVQALTWSQRHLAKEIIKTF